ncbi:hypothetical protein BGZ91_009516, partial [Linnemannia elongata]
MNGNTLTNKAVPVSMTGTSYILDQDPATRTVVIYSINVDNPFNIVANLTKITPSSGGGTPLYSGTLVATYLSKTIVVYTLDSDNKPSMNSFDIATSKWSEVKVKAGSSSGGGGGGVGRGLNTALSIVVYVASFLLLACIIRCFWGTIKSLFYCITGKPRNDDVPVVPVQPIILEKIDEPSKPQQIVYIDNSVNVTSSKNDNT